MFIDFPTLLCVEWGMSTEPRLNLKRRLRALSNILDDRTFNLLFFGTLVVALVTFGLSRAFKPTVVLVGEPSHSWLAWLASRVGAPNASELFYYALGFLFSMLLIVSGIRAGVVLKRKKHAENDEAAKRAKVVSDFSKQVALAVEGTATVPVPSAKANETRRQRELERLAERDRMRQEQVAKLEITLSEQMNQNAHLSHRLIESEALAKQQKLRQEEIQRIQATLAAQLEREKAEKETTQKLQEAYAERDTRITKELEELKSLIAIYSQRPRLSSGFIEIQKKADDKRRRERELEELKATLREEIEKSNADRSTGINQGYILIDLAEEHKEGFRDMLMGFEAYAKLRGYTINISVDTSITNKLGFKFTFGINGVGVPAQQVQTDMSAYMEMFNKGNVEDIPMVLPPERHRLLLLALKNRISIAENTAQMQRHMLDDYKGLLQQVLGNKLPVGSPQTLYIAGGTAQAFAPVQSPQAVLGDNAQISGNTVYIGETHRERQQQVELVEALRKALGEHREGIPEDKLQDANKNLEKVKEELSEQSKPEPSRVRRYLENTKNALATAAMGYEVTEAVRKLWEAFHLAL